MKRMYSDLARSILGGGWRHECPDDKSSKDEVMQTALLYAIARELQTLNLLLQCPNFIGIPESLKEIAKNTGSKRKKLRIAKTG